MSEASDYEMRREAARIAAGAFRATALRGEEQQADDTVALAREIYAFLKEGAASEAISQVSGGPAAPAA